MSLPNGRFYLCHYLAISSACNFFKKEALAQEFSCEIQEIFKNTFSYRTLPVAASSKTSYQRSFFKQISLHSNFSITMAGAVMSRTSMTLLIERNVMLLCHLCYVNPALLLFFFLFALLHSSVSALY